MELTTLMYGRIPKRKARNAPPEQWLLSKDNILQWQNDLDAFESALYATDIDDQPDINPLEELDLHMEWVPKNSKLGKYLYKWWPAATANRHSYIGDLQVKNLWLVRRNADEGRLKKVQEKIIKQKPAVDEGAHVSTQNANRLGNGRPQTVQGFQHGFALSRHAQCQRPRDYERVTSAAQTIGRRRHYGGDVRTGPVLCR